MTHTHTHTPTFISKLLKNTWIFTLSALKNQISWSWLCWKPWHCLTFPTFLHVGFVSGLKLQNICRRPKQEWRATLNYSLMWWKCMSRKPLKYTLVLTSPCLKWGFLNCIFKFTSGSSSIRKKEYNSTLLPSAHPLEKQLWFVLLWLLKAAWGAEQKQWQGRLPVYGTACILHLLPGEKLDYETDLPVILRLAMAAFCSPHRQTFSLQLLELMLSLDDRIL